jgi:uncharacterized protein (DUF58 family)
VAAIGLWFTVVTTSLIGLIAIPVILLMSMDLGMPSQGAPKPNLVANRSLDRPKSLVGEPVVVQLTVRNEGDDIERLFLTDSVPAGAKVTKGSPFLACRLRKGASAALRYEMTVKDPVRLVFGEFNVRIMSPFGMKETSLSMSAPVELKVYPKLPQRRVGASHGKALTWTGFVPSKLRGGHVEFMDIRGYVPGDPLRDVNWKASGRRGEMLVNEWTLERGIDCIVVVDLEAEHLPTVGDWNARSEVITCTNELVNSLASSGNRVGLLILGSTLTRIKPGFGPRQRRFMLDQLIDSVPGIVWKAEHVEDLLEMLFRTQYRKRGGTILFISPGVSMPLLETVRTLSSKRFYCTVVMVNTLDSERAAILTKNALARSAADTALHIARAELDWYELQYGGSARVLEWGLASGFTAVGRSIVS